MNPEIAMLLEKDKEIATQAAYITTLEGQFREIRDITLASQEDLKDEIRYLKGKREYLEACLSENEETHREEMKRQLRKNERLVKAFQGYRLENDHRRTCTKDLFEENEELEEELDKEQEKLREYQIAVTDLKDQLSKAKRDFERHIQTAKEAHQTESKTRYLLEQKNDECTQKEWKIRQLSRQIATQQKALDIFEPLNRASSREELQDAITKGFGDNFKTMLCEAMFDIQSQRKRIERVEGSLQTAVTERDELIEKYNKLENEFDKLFLCKQYSAEDMRDMRYKNQVLKVKLQQARDFCDLHCHLEKAPGNHREIYEFLKQKQTSDIDLYERTYTAERKQKELEQRLRAQKVDYDNEVSDLEDDIEKLSAKLKYLWMELETAKNGQAQGDTITNAPGNSTTVNNHTDSTSPDRPLTPDSNEANNRSSFRHMARIHRELGYDVPENVFPGEGSVDEYKCLYSPTFHAFGRLYPGLKQVASHHKEIKFAVPAIQPLTAAQIRREMRQEVQTQLNPKTTGTCANDDASTEQLPISIATLHISENDKKMDEMARVLKRPDSALSPPSRGEHTGLIEDNPNDYEICPGVHVGIPACMLPKFGQIAQAEQEVQVLFQGLDGERDVPEIPPWENSDSPQVPELQHKSHI